MKPIKFKHVNITYAKDQKEYQALPALLLKGKEGQVVTCWKLTRKERLKILFTGKVWMSLFSFHKPLMPSLLSVNRKNMYSHKDDNLTLFQKLKKYFKDEKNTNN